MDDKEMKDRIAHIIRAKNLTAAEFAMQLGIQPSSISHLLSGRNNPSLDFVRKLKETFPEYNLDWIIMGDGAMTVSEPFAEPRPRAEVLPSLPLTNNPKPAESDSNAVFDAEIPSASELGRLPSAEAHLKQILFIYDNHTFEVFRPR